jgi:archaellum biogenesis ATPase FlaH
MSVIAERYGIDLTREAKVGCPRCIREGRDNSRNNLHVYASTESAHCWSCGWTIASQEHREAMGWDDEEDYYEESEVSTKELLTQEQADSIKEQTGNSGKGSRDITDETYKAYAVRFKYDETTGDITDTFYPYTEDYKPAGYKIRMIPKDFRSVGKIGKDSELFGQWKWKNGSGKYVVITAGEVDCMSAFQMLEDYRKSRSSDFAAIPCVSSGIGEAGSYKQIQKHYEWLATFERIIICYDQDEAGKKAVQKLVEVLPKGKMFVMNLPMKDVNEMLTKGKQKQFISSFYDAKPYSPDGIVGTSGLLASIREAAMVPKIPLPPFMHEVEKEMAGGIPLGVILNLASASGTGKSTIVDECNYFWVFHSPHRIGTVTLESDKDQYGTKMLSRHVGVKIDLIESIEDKLAFLDRPDIVAASQELFTKPDGTDRWHLIEDRDGGLESMKALIMELIIACECKVIILDPVSDLLEGLDNEKQASFCKWMKGVVKSHKVTFINVTHVRKSGSGQKANSTGADMHEEDIFGSGSLIKSAACNLLFTRNKEAEDVMERNTTYMKMSKCRWTGRTGIAGQYYYDNNTHTMHDKQDWLEKNLTNF